MYTKSLTNIEENDVEHAGQRAVDLVASTEQKLNLPEGFVILSETFDKLIENNNLKPKIDFLLSHLDQKTGHGLMNVYSSVRKMCNGSELPEGLEDELKDMYESLAAAGLGLENKTHPVRVIVSTNAPEDPENNDTVIQNVRDWKEFLVAVRESWALAFLPTQLGYRLMHKYDETRLKIAILVQVMQPTEVTAHTHSAMPEDGQKVYAEVYYGYPDLREKITKDYYSITKSQLEIVLTELHTQGKKLIIDDNGELVLEQISKTLQEDKIIRRKVEELARLTKKVERAAQAPVKCFFSVEENQFILLWANRLPHELLEEVEQSAPVETAAIEVVDLDETEEPLPDVAVAPEEEDTRTLNEVLESPEDQFAHAEHAAEEAIMDAAVPEPVEETKEKGSAKLFASSLRMAMNVIEKKYDDKFGQVGDDFADMIAQLNNENTFSRPIDAELFKIAHAAVQHELELSETDYEKLVDEITFVIQT